MLLLSSVSTFLFRDMGYEKDAVYIGKEVQLRGYITEISYAENFGSRFFVNADTINDVRGHSTVEVTVPYRLDGECRDEISVRGTFRNGLEEEDGLSSRLYAFAKGNIFCLESEREDTCEIFEEKAGIGTFFYHIRQKVASVLDRYCEKDTASFLRAVFLGDRSELSPAVTRDFRRTGLSHILAVSGLHLSILTGIFDWLMRKFRISRTLRIIILFFSVLFYIGLSSAPLSVIRAAVMLFFAYGAYLLREDADPVTSLFTALFLIVLFRPSAVFDVGVQLSFCATLGILYLGVPTEKKVSRKLSGTKLRFLTPIVQAGCISASAILFTVPISVFTFGEISVFGILINLFTEPFAVLFLICSPVLMLLSLFPAAAAACGKIVSGFCRFLLSVIHRIALMKYASVYAGTALGMLLAGAFVVYVLIVILRSGRRVRIFIAFSVCAALFTVFQFAVVPLLGQDEMLLYQAAETNEAILCRSGTKTAVIDVSDGSSSALYPVMRQCAKTGGYEIEILVETHLHTRLPATVNKIGAGYLIRKILVPQPTTEKESDILKTLKECAEKQDIEIACYASDRVTEISFCDMAFLFAPLCRLSRSEEPLVSFMIRTEGGNTAYVSRVYPESGPYYQTVCRKMIDECDVLLIGMHGPRQKEVPVFTFRPRIKSWTHDPEIVRVNPYIKQTGQLKINCQ